MTEKRVTLPVIGMKGRESADSLTIRLKGVEGLADISVDLQTKKVSFRLTRPESPNGQLHQALEEIKNVGLDVSRRMAEVDIYNMRCAGCVASLESGLKKIPGITDVRINFATKMGRIEMVEGVYDPRRLIDDIRNIGYEADFHIDDRKAEQANDQQRRDLRLSILCTIALFLLHFGEHVLGWFVINPIVSATIQFFLTLPVLYAGREFFSDAWSQLNHKRANMNSLIALGSGSALFISLIITIQFILGVVPLSNMVYYDTTAMILTFILIGRFLESRATKEARDAAIGIADLIPKTVSRLTTQGGEEEIDIAELIIDDIVIVRPGQSIPADGIIVEGETATDESMITGESLPVPRKKADAVIGGTVNLNGGIQIKITRVGSGTVLARMVRMVREAQVDKAPIQRMADKVAGIFVPIVIGIALLTLAVWAIFDSSSRMLFMAPVAVLLVACPCALGLATPTAILVGTGRAARLGILFRNGAILERMTKANCFIFDKTGTLTEGHPVVEQVMAIEGQSPDKILALAASAEQYSEHPFGRAIRERAVAKGLSLTPTEKHTYTPGQGITAIIDGAKVVVGRRSYVMESGLNGEHAVAFDDVEKTENSAVVHIARDNYYLGAIIMADTLKDGASGTVNRLLADGHDVYMLTGDNRFSARAVADKLGIKKIEADMTPQKKLATVQSLRRSGYITAMVGDGVNDAAALTSSDIGIALGSGTDIAIKASDVTIIGRSLGSIITALDISRTTLKIIRQNLFWAFFYNIIMIPIAAGVFHPFFGVDFSPAMAAAAMAFSSVFVVTNSLRLKNFQPSAVIDSETN